MLYREAAFDAADLRVDPETVRAVLTPAVRSTLMALQEGSFQAGPSAVEHCVEGKLLDPDRVQKVLTRSRPIHGP